MTEKPYIYQSGWTFSMEVELPKKEGYLTFGVTQFGSAFDPAKITLPLPPKDFEDDSLKEFPPAHQEAFYELVDIVKNEITRRGFKHDTHGDFLINEDYYPSTGVSVSVMKPEVLTKELARQLQSKLQNRQFSFFVEFLLVLDDPAYKGKDEGITIREDRIVEDWNAKRLRRELGRRFAWSS
jgi:hypothetical protein